LKAAGKPSERPGTGPETGKDRRKRKPATAEYVERAGQYYLARYASSVANFRAVLQRKIARRGLAPGVPESEAEGWIEALIKRFVAVGLLDDRAYGRARLESLTRQGRSRRVVRGDLLRKGLDADLVDDLMAAQAEDGADPEVDAVIAFARRRRLGPFARQQAADPSREKQRALAAFARAGFGYGLARRVLDAEDEDALLCLYER